MITLNELFHYNTLPNYQGLIGKHKIKSPDEYVGIEIELEGIHNHINEIQSFNIVHDGSLKDNGLELVSIPIQMKFLEVELDRILGDVQEAKVSDRCSLHVHLNVSDLSVDELNAIILLYTIYEKSLFRLSGDRWENNYCIPLYECPDIVKDFYSHPLKGWHKYFAFNLAPIWGNPQEGTARLGTIEFRHHRGTKDALEIITWCNYITSLKEYIKGKPLDELVELLISMNTTSFYYTLTQDIFGELSTNITEMPSFKDDIESCITRAKEVLLKNGEIKPLLKKQPAPLKNPKKMLEDMGTITWHTHNIVPTTTDVVHDGAVVVDEFWDDDFLEEEGDF